MRPIVPVLALVATAAAAGAGLALRHGRDATGPSRVEAGVTRCTSDARCTFEGEGGALSPARSHLRVP